MRSTGRIATFRDLSKKRRPEFVMLFVPVFTTLDAVELDVPVFMLSGVEPIAVDLNTDFSDVLGRTFDLVTAVEIIEHLDSPRHFLGEIWKLLKPGGHLVISTPNIAHWVGRIWFLLGSELRYFKESDYHHQRHISPINHTHMRLTLREVGFEIVESGTAGSFYGPLKRLVTAPVSGLFRLAQGPVAGDTILYLARKTSPDDASPGRSSDVCVRRYHTTTTPS